jgi:hypothetical protein
MQPVCFCSGSRVGCDGLRECRRHACRYSENPRARITILRREPAERAREGSAARSIQRMKMRRVGRCRVTAAQELAMNTPRTRPPERENSRRRISHRCVPNPSFSQKRQRAGLYSTAPAKIVSFASQAWNGMGTRFAPCACPRPLRRTRNDSRSRSRNRSQSQPLRNAQPDSSRTQSLTRGESQIFSSESRIGAIAADGVLSGGTTSGTAPIEVSGSWGCSMRVAISIAVKSRTPARK